MVDVIYDACSNGGLFVASIDLYPTKLAEAAHLLLPAAHPGEMNLTSMNGERRLRLSEKFMDPPGEAKPDCLIAAHIANTIKAMYQKDGNAEMVKRFSGFDWKTEEDAFNDGFRRAGQPGAGPIDSQGGDTGNLATYERLRDGGQQRRAVADQGVQGRQADRHRDALHWTASSTPRTARPKFKPSPWPGLPKTVADQKAKYKFWINNGRVNEVWQTGYHDQYNAFVRGR